MQYKKESVRSRILSAARANFLCYGFYGSSIKDIAQAASVPIGNLYRYFDGKNALIDEVVGVCYERILEQVDSLELDEFLIESVVKRIKSEVDHYKTELLILAYKCGGTKYGDFSDKVSAIIRQKVKSKQRNNLKDLTLIDVIITSTIISIFELIRISEDEKLEENISKLLAFTVKELNEII